MTYIVSLPLHISYGTVLVLVGIVTYAYFNHIRCDPLKASRIVIYFFCYVVVGDEENKVSPVKLLKLST